MFFEISFMLIFILMRNKKDKNLKPHRLQTVYMKHFMSRIIRQIGIFHRIVIGQNYLQSHLTKLASSIPRHASIARKVKDLSNT